MLRLCQSAPLYRPPVHIPKLQCHLTVIAGGIQCEKEAFIIEDSVFPQKMHNCSIIVSEGDLVPEITLTRNGETLPGYL